MSNMQLTNLEFDLIKENLKNYLLDQNILKDADYEASVLSILLNILAYNTHYNAYYLNMAVNEMFLDTAQKRNSVVSISKQLGYVPSSVHSCAAIINVKITGLSVEQFTLDKYTKFISSTYDQFFTFVTNQSYTTNVVNGTATFNNIQIIEGEIASPGTYGVRYVYRSAINPNSIFTIKDETIDLNTLEVIVQKSTIDPTIEIFLPKENFSYLDSSSNVYFVEESNNGFYNLYFGDGVLGKQLNDGNVVYIQYLISSGNAPEKATNFSMISQLSTEYKNIIIETVTPAFGGQNKEDIDSIKFSAPKYFSAQNRAVSYQDYMTALQHNNYNFSFDAVNVWGGEDNIPPVYGKVFIALKPKGAYALTLIEKEFIKNKILKPINVITVQPEIIDPDYVFIKLNIKYIYDKNKTFYNYTKLNQLIKNTVYEFSSSILNTFNSVFDLPELMYKINNTNSAILTNECKVYVEKKFIPVESNSNYTLDFGCELQKGMLKTNLTSYPPFSMRHPANYSDIINEITLEEIPLSFSGISSIKVLNPGVNYSINTKIIIEGDGKNAVAHPVIINGAISSVVIDDPGYGYSEAKIIIDGNGTLAKCVSVIESGIGNIRGYYYSNGIKTIITKDGKTMDFGTIDYKHGIVNLKNFNPLKVDNTFGELTINAVPASDIIYSKGSKLITIDPFYPNSVEVSGVVR